MCFDGYCIVAMADGSQKLVKTIKKGDKVLGGTIECVVRTKSDDGKMEYCKTPSGMLITNYHPIKINHVWVHPISMYDHAFYDSEYMYSFLLEKEKVLVKIVQVVGKKNIFNCLPFYRKMNISTKDNYEELWVRPKTMVINNTEVVTLAHNIKNDSIASHDYFGTEKVVETLERCKGFTNGLITFQSDNQLFSKNDSGCVSDINIEFENFI
jgi:hypothetical protein